MTYSNRGSILVLDDDSTFRGLVRNILESHGFSVIEAGSPDEASNLLANNEIALAIVDYRLPHMDGMTWITRLRESGRQTPIVFCSAIPCDLHTFNWLRNILKVALIVQKPILPESFIEEIDSLLPHYEKRYDQAGIDCQTRFEGSSVGAHEELELRQLRKKMQIEKAVLQARAEYLKELAVHWKTLTELINLHNNDKKNTSIIIEATHITHRIKGTAGSLGLVEVSQKAAKVENFLASLDGQEDTAQEVIWSEVIREVAEGHRVIAQMERQEEDVNGHSNVPHILLVSDAYDAELASNSDEIRAVANIELTDNLAGIATHFARARIEAVILDTAYLDRASSLRWCAEIRRLAGISLPVAFICEEKQHISDEQLLYGGASAAIRHPITTKELLEVVDKLVSISKINRPRVLAIDDDEVLCQFVMHVLETEHIETKTCTNPIEGLSLIDDFEPDLILLDIMMPAMTGYEVCRQIRANENWKDIPVVFLTSKTSPDARAASFAVGGSDFVTKPILACELLNRVSQQLVHSIRQHGTRCNTTSGIMGGDDFILSASELFARHRRNFQQMAVALLAIDDYQQLKLVQGHFPVLEAVDSLGELLQLHFKAEDIKAKWSDSGFAIAFNNCNRETAVAALQILEDEFARKHFSGNNFDFAATFSAGVAGSEHDGETLEECIRVAYQRMQASMRNYTGAINASI